MRFIWVLIILQAANAANNDTTTKEYLDLSNAEDNVFLWKNLFIKLNTVLSETEKLGQGLGDVNKRLDDLNKRQTDHENRLTKLMENVLESRVESMKRQQDQENQLSKLMENVNEIREDAKRRQEDQEKLQTQLMANVNASRVDANLRLQKLILKQEDQENRQTKLLENIVEIRADAKKLQEAQEKRQTQLMANVNASRVDNNISQWTTILRRQDGSVNFNRKWDEYKNGFGNPNADFFIGLELLHAMTTNGLAQELLIILIDFENETRYARYDLFRIGSEADKYAIKELGTYSGDAGDGMGWHRGKKFSTFDKDNNAGEKRDCPQSFKGGWWFHDPCYSGHLNGPYRLQKDSKTWGVSWHPWREWNVSMKYAAMMIRPKL